MELELAVIESSGDLNGGRVEIAMGHGEIDGPSVFEAGEGGVPSGLPAVGYLGAMATHALIQLAAVLSVMGFMAGMTLRAVVEIIQGRIQGQIAPDPVGVGGAGVAVEFTLENR